jgi:F0F1-type ATP synthase membrane subunit b/b'
MPQELFDKDGNLVEALTPEEVEARLNEIKEQTRVEIQETIESLQTQLNDKEAELKIAQEELIKEKSKDKNLAGQRKVIEEKVKEIETLKADVDKIKNDYEAKFMEIERRGRERMITNMIDELAGNDKNLADKIKFYYEDLLKLKELLPDNLKLFMVYYKDKPIAGSNLFICNEIVTLCFYNMLLYEYEHLKPIHRVMYEVVKWSTENGYQYVDIGVSQDTKAANPMTPSISLIDFKEKFDARTVMRNTLKYTY